MKREERKKERNTHICDICGDAILPDTEAEPVHIKTRRRTELWIHKECFAKVQEMNRRAFRNTN